MDELRISAYDQQGETSKTPLKFSKKSKSRKWSRKKKVLIIFAMIFVLLGGFGFQIFNSLSKIFENSGFSLPGLLGDMGQLKGEANGRVNILLLGIGDEEHSGANLSDTMIVASLDTKKNTVSMISIPRDFYVNIPGYGYAKINEAHAYGESKRKGEGPDKAKETVAQLFDIPIHYYARVDFSGFSKIVDAVGGVDIYVSQDLYDPYYPAENGAEVVYSIDKGMHHMNGKEALRYVRSRKTTSDFDRARRQQEVLVAVKEKILSTETVFNPKRVLEISSILGEHIRTDLQINELKRMYALSKDVSKDNVVSKVIDEKETGLLVGGMSDAGASILRPASGNYRDIREFVQSVFYESYVREESAKISVLNGSGVNGLADRLSKSLKEGSYNVIQVDTAEASQKKTVIYDYSNDKKPYTVEFLAKKLNAEVIKKSETNSADIVIILGSNYKASN